MNKEKAVLLYDGECPICKRFALYLRVREHIDMDLRPVQEAPELLSELLLQGYDINEGMILMMKGRIFQGEQAIQALEWYIEEKTNPGLGWKLMRVNWLRKLIYVCAKAIRVISYRLRGRSGDLTKFVGKGAK